MTVGEENERERAREREVLTLKELIHYSEVATLSVTLSEIRHLYCTEKVTYNSAQLQTATTHRLCSHVRHNYSFTLHRHYTAWPYAQTRKKTHVHYELLGEAVKRVRGDVCNDALFELSRNQVNAFK